MNDLPYITKCLTPVIYADDTTMFTTININNHVAIQEDINKELKLVSDWLKLNKLSLNSEKTKAMLFHSPQRQVDVPNIYIDDNKIDFVK